MKIPKNTKKIVREDKFMAYADNYSKLGTKDDETNVQTYQK